jgi:hypothetical protein
MAIQRFEGICSGCHSQFSSTVFEFHHWDSTEKDFEIATAGMGRSWPAILEELSKCVMLCANCHCEIHAGDLVLDRPVPQPAAVAV